MKDWKTGDVNGRGAGGVDVMNLSLSRFSAPLPLTLAPSDSERALVSVPIASRSLVVRKKGPRFPRL